MTTTQMLDTDLAHDLADKLVTFMETNLPPDGLFADDVFLDISFPQWRLQSEGVTGAVAIRDQHPAGGRVPRSRLDVTGTGFVLELEEEWVDAGQQWYCRELVRCDVTDGLVSQITVYCTGDWDEARVAEHREAVTLIRP